MVNKTARHIEKSTKKVLTNIKNYWLTNPQEDDMKYSDKIQIYEAEKRKLIETCKTAVEYEQKIMKLAERLKI